MAMVTENTSLTEELLLQMYMLSSQLYQVHRKSTYISIYLLRYRWAMYLLCSEAHAIRYSKLTGTKSFIISNTKAKHKKLCFIPQPSFSLYIIMTHHF